MLPAALIGGWRRKLFAPLWTLRPEQGTSSWLLQLRWIAVLGQLVTIGAVSYYFREDLPIRELLALVGFTAATNVAYWWWLREQFGLATADAADSTRARVIVALMIIDLGTLTGMLHFSGGIDNPFASFYFVNLAVGGVILQPRWAWALAALAITGFGWLLISYTPIELLQAYPVGIGNTTRRFGAFVAFSACALVITYFVTRTAEELTRRERELRAAEDEQARSRQLEGLSTLAAGAAHELATPMSTIAVIARELDREMETIEVPRSVREDLKLINSQLSHCRMILARMRSAAGDYTADRWDRTTVGELIDSVLEGIREPHRVEVADSIDATEDLPLWLPREAVAQAIRNLVHNGLDASPEETVVTLEAADRGDRFELQIRDSGGGMSEKVLDRIGEPFFTTKEPGRGMGLGLFLTRNVIKRLGGTLVFDSLPGRGTAATVTLPCGTESHGEL